jgi:pimeloyl-ACP methyl ester carboxylesterase
LVTTGQGLPDPKFKDMMAQGEAGSTDAGLSFLRAIIARSVPEERLQDAARILRLTPMDTRTSDLAAAGEFDYMIPLGCIDLPTLVIAGSADPIASLSHARDWEKRISGSRVVVLEGVGHHPPLEAAEEVAEEILLFMHNIESFSRKIAIAEVRTGEAAAPRP